MIGLSADEKMQLLREITYKQKVASYTLDHVLFSDACTCGQKVDRPFVYDFCPIAGDPEFLKEDEPDYDMSNFDREKSKYV